MRAGASLFFRGANTAPTPISGKENPGYCISPAAVDMGGMVITPLERDFRNVNAAFIESVFEEVSVAPEIFEQFASGR